MRKPLEAGNDTGGNLGNGHSTLKFRKQQLSYEILNIDARNMDLFVEPKSVQMCVTSPPYFGLRDYGVAGQLGLEQTPEEYIANMVEVFRRVRDVLTDDGTLWLNIGDSYANDSKWGGSSGGKHAKALHGNTSIGRTKVTTCLKPKDLIGIPWMLAFALRADGWFLRQDIIWHKPNPMPESVRDRCTKAHEYVFLLSKSEKYFFDAEAMREPAVKGPQRMQANPETARLRSVGPMARGEEGFNHQYADSDRVWAADGKRNRRSVWTVATRPYKGAHFATFPPALIEPTILAGTSERGHCPQCLARWVRDTGRECLKCGDFVPTQAKSCGGCGHVNDWKSGRIVSDAHLATDWSTPGNGTPRHPGGFSNNTVARGWRPTCTCGCDPVPDIVLDPFMGSGTTAQVALQHGRRAIGCELNPAYIDLIHHRLAT